MALRMDGTVIAWGRPWEGQTMVPADLSQVEMIAAGGYHSVALRSDGAIIAWGGGYATTGAWPNAGQARVPVGLPTSVHVSAGYSHTVALLGPVLPPCPEDLDTNRTIDMGDIGIALMSFGESDSRADLDGSGTVDFGDLGLLMLAFGACPG